MSGGNGIQKVFKVMNLPSWIKPSLPDQDKAPITEVTGRSNQCILWIRLD